jgi:putative transposase
MKTLLLSVLAFLRDTLRSRLSMQIEIVALRHQLTVYQRSQKRPRIKPADRLFWSYLSRLWSGWQRSLVFVQPRTVIAWRRRKFREYWTWLSRGGKPGRPALGKELRDLIRRMSVASPTWGSPRIVSELKKLGIDLAKSTVEKYMVRPRKPPSPTWRAFLKNHVGDLVSIDFFVVPTMTFKVLFVFVVLAHHRRRVVHFNVTENPTAEWTAQQIVEAFPWDTAPRYLLRDRDGVYGQTFRGRVKNMGIKEVLIAPRSPWQTPYVERLIGSIRRECLVNLVVLNERHLRRHLVSYFAHYHRWRCHQSLQMDTPTGRPVQPPERGSVVAIEEAGGLYRHYERRAA